MELRQPVSLLRSRWKKLFQQFSTLAEIPHKMFAMHKLQCVYCRRNREHVHNTGKVLPVDKHTQHTTVWACMCGWPYQTSVPIINDTLAAVENKTCFDRQAVRHLPTGAPRYHPENTTLSLIHWPGTPGLLSNISQ